MHPISRFIIVVLILIVAMLPIIANEVLMPTMAVNPYRGWKRIARSVARNDTRYVHADSMLGKMTLLSRTRIDRESWAVLATCPPEVLTHTAPTVVVKNQHLLELQTDCVDFAIQCNVYHRMGDDYVFVVSACETIPKASGE